MTQTSLDPPVGDGLLTAGEQATLARLHVAKRRSDWRLGRWTAKRALAAYVGCVSRLVGVEIRAAESGAPEVFLDGRPVPLTLSLSHAAGRGLCAITAAGLALGCDLERIESHSRAFVADYFTDDEQRVISATSAADRACIVTLLWSAKESALKALRVGLMRDPRELEVTAAADGLLVVTDARGGTLPGRWRRDGGDVFTFIVA